MTETSKATQATQATSSHNSLFRFGGPKVGDKDTEWSPGQLLRLEIERTKVGYTCSGIAENDGSPSYFSGVDLLQTFATDCDSFIHEYPVHGHGQVKKYTLPSYGDSVKFNFTDKVPVSRFTTAVTKGVIGKMHVGDTSGVLSSLERRSTT